jgi:hypothetical protein
MYFAWAASVHRGWDGPATLMLAWCEQVKIWNLLPVVDVQQEVNPVTPKLLATLADHYSPVNIARFSRDGRRLASGVTWHPGHSGATWPQSACRG